MIEIPVSFSHNNVDYKYILMPIGAEQFPTVFQVFDHAKRNYIGQLIYYSFSDEWDFHPNQDIAQALGDIVVLWYE